MRKYDELIFDEQTIPKDMLKALFVQILIENKVTYGEFIEKHRMYMLREGKDSREIVSSRNNLIRTMLEKNDITFRMVDRIIRKILGLNPTSLSMTVRDRSNTAKTYHVDQVFY